jgi:hypothetical protein
MSTADHACAAVCSAGARRRSSSGRPRPVAQGRSPCPALALDHTAAVDLVDFHVLGRAEPRERHRSGRLRIGESGAPRRTPSHHGTARRGRGESSGISFRSAPPHRKEVQLNPTISWLFQRLPNCHRHKIGHKGRCRKPDAAGDAEGRTVIGGYGGCDLLARCYDPENLPRTDLGATSPDGNPFKQ